ncbi:RHS repeat-associated core domain-containing protein [Nitrospira sp. M1]
MPQSFCLNKHPLQTVALVGFLSLFAINLPPTQAAPVEPMAGSTMSFDAAPEEGTNYNSGDWGVAEQNGAATYTYRINVPPGRNDMAPALALRYSSHSPLRGGLAVGWNLQIPSIQADLSLGVTNSTQYKIDLGSASGRLVEVLDTSPYGNSKAYRVQYDNSNTRIFASYSPGPRSDIVEWVALTPDGIRHYFKESSSRHVGGFAWHIARQVDPHGNTIRYNWSDIDNTHVVIGESLTSIEYTSNESAGLIPHAKVEFEYDPMQFCVDTDTTTTPPVDRISEIPIGAAYRQGRNRRQNVLDPYEFKQVTGAQQLSAVKIHVRDTQASDWRLSQNIDFKYQLKRSILTPAPGLTQSELNPLPPQFRRCEQNPLRYLTQIDMEAFGADGTGTIIPPINFQYNHRIDTSGPLTRGGNRGEHMPLIEVNSPGFGQAGTSGGEFSGLKTTLLDIDNDGIRDRVSVIEKDKICTLVWRKGLLGGAFDSKREAALPTAAWYRDWSNRAPNPSIDDREGCSLNGQIAYRTEPSTILDEPNDKYVKGIVSYHFMDYTGDGRIDFITNTYAPFSTHCSYDPWATSCSVEPRDRKISGFSSYPLVPEKNNRWRVYAGTGNPDQPFTNNLARSGVPPRITVDSPLPLPPSAGEEVIDLNKHTNYSVPVLFDLDGDGFLDIIASQIEGQRRGSQTLGNEKIRCRNKILLRMCDWTVYFGNGGSKFPERNEAFLWRVPKNITLASDKWILGTVDGTDEYIQSRATVINLHDMNGDGLSDLIVQKFGDEKMYSYRNTGTGFEGQAHPINGSSVLEEAKTEINNFSGGTLTDGDRGYVRRLQDLDGDGLLDMVWFEGSQNDITVTRKVKAKFNLGNRFGNEVTLLFPEKWTRSKRLLSAKLKSGYISTWHLATDFTDVSGDGLADLVQWYGKKMSYISSPGLPKAPDLLSKVTNGRGMELTFSYAPSTDPEVVTWTGNTSDLAKDNSALPHVTWVVKAMTVTGGHNTPRTTTQHRYQNPIYLSAEDLTGFKERSKFAGFSKNIQITNYENGTSKQIIKQYHYNGLHGDLINIQTFRDGQLHRVERKKWEHKTLFDGRIHVALPILTTSCMTNASNMSENDCFAQNDHVHRIEQTWLHNSISHQFQNTHQVEGEGNTQQADDHRTSYHYDLRYGTVTGHTPEDYRVRVRETTEAIRGAFAPFKNRTGRSRTEFNDQTGLPDKRDIYFDHTSVATTNLIYDATTGNLVKRQKPEQSLSNGGKDSVSSFSYDSHQLFVQSTSNELGHKTGTAHDTATGVLIKRVGPNFIKTPSGIIYDTERWDIDGFGRVLFHDISIDTLINGQANYAEHTVERFTYNDMNFQNSGQPVSHRAEQLRDIGGTHWITTEQDMDGIGRVLETRQLFNGDMATHTIYRYRDSGGIDSIETPDPSDPDNRITYTYDYDGLGRVTRLQRPDDTSISVSYEGLSQTISEVTPDNSGGSKTKRSDVFGHLVELQEHHSGSSSAITRYQYDVVDNLKKITDAEGNITTMSHDWQGNRIGITRGQRHWQFRYDLNSNLTSRQSPMPGGSDPAPYTTTYEYDDLDRLLEKRFVDIRVSTAPSHTNTPPATGALSTTLYQYDAGHNGVGRLSQVDLPFGVVIYDYDARGLIAREEREFSLDQIANMRASQVVERTYNALGQLTESDWQGEKWRIKYDERGLVDSVDWFDPTAPAAIAWKSVANYERELIGLPLARNTDFGQTRRFTYDALARPLTDSVQLDGSIEMLAERSYEYTGAGNLGNVVGNTNGVSANATYTYDRQHRLLTAVAPNGYQGNFTYSSTGNVLTANVVSANAAETRNVSYSYGQVDPQAVDTLQDITTDDSYAEFAYDNVGNMTWRRAPDGDTLLHWNGQDQIRRVDTPDGSETYYYDHAGQRMLVVNPDQGVRFWFGEREIHYKLGGTETLNYLHLSAGGPTLARVENDTEIELQYADALQNLMFSLDKDSNATASFLYGPFGEVLSETGSEAHRRQFNGKENDVTTGLRYYGFRYYDPLVMRWNSADPLYLAVPELGQNQPQRMNLYAFSLNNPVRYYDPNGRKAKETTDESHVIIAYGEDEKDKETEKSFMKVGEKLEKELIEKDKDGKAIKKGKVRLVSFKDVKKAKEAIAKEGGKVSAFVTISHGNQRGAASPTKGSSLKVTDLAEIGGVEKGGVVIAIGCGTCDGRGLSDLHEKGIVGAGFQGDVGFSSDGNLEYPPGGEPTSPGATRPDRGTSISFKPIRNLILQAGERVNVSSPVNDTVQK